MTKIKKKILDIIANTHTNENTSAETREGQTKMLKWTALIILLIAGATYQGKAISRLQQDVTAARTVYVYSLEEAMQGINAAEKKKKFEEEAFKLNEEVMAAEKKIKNFKDKELKRDFTDMYLNSLRLKRDNLVEDYHKMLEELSEKVNKGLAEIAEEHNAGTIFYKSAVAVDTPYVVDVTPELIAKLKK